MKSITIVEHADMPIKVKDLMDTPWGIGILVGSVKEPGSNDGMLIPITFDELRSIHWNIDEQRYQVRVDTTEGEEIYLFADILFIGNIEEYSKEQNISLEYFS